MTFKEGDCSEDGSSWWRALYGEHEYDPIFYDPQSTVVLLIIIGSATATGFCKSTEVLHQAGQATAPAASRRPCRRPALRRRPIIRSFESRLRPSSTWNCRPTIAGLTLRPVHIPFLAFLFLYVLVNNIWTNIGTSGTKGRTCSRDKGTGLSASQRRSCIHLCRNCGHKVKRRVSTVLTSCNCTFQW